MNQVSTSNRGFQWNFIPLAVVMPPSMTVPERDKNEAYHATWTRFFLSRQNSQWINYYLNNYVTNLDYAIDSKWGEESDVRMYLGDKAAQTSRIPFRYPIISPTLTRMVGAVDNISIAAKAQSATQRFAQTRKEDKWMQVKTMIMAAQAGPMMTEAYSQVGVTPDETKQEGLFDMSYQDHIERGANSLMSMLFERNKLDDTKRTVAAYMALSGLGAIHNFVNGQNIESEVCEPREVGWDTSAMKPDLSDGQFVYHCPLMDVGAVAERWQPKAGIIKALDLWSRILPYGDNFQAGWPQSRPRVFTLYWKDFKKVDRGFVMKDGEIEFCTINVEDPDTGEILYTDADLIEPPKNKFTMAWTDAERKNKKQTRYIQTVRYCSMIPWEYLPGGYTKGAAYGSSNLPPKPPMDTNLPDIGIAGDVILDWGEYPLQEADPDDVYSVRFPIKFSTWRYLGGHMVAPLTAAIDPQRWMNQVTSDVAWRMRKAGHVAPLFANEALAGSNMTEQDVTNAMKEGDPIFVNAAALGGLPQATGTVDTSPSAAVYNMMAQLPQLKMIAESSVNVYEANSGAPQGPDQLVGTLQLQLQQAGIAQQPFYAAIADLYKQQNQFYAQAGKQFYARMPWMLSQMVGEEDMEALIATKDMQLEQFRVEIKLSPDGQQLRTVTDQQIIPALMQLGMLDPVTAAQLMGQSIPDDAYAAARKYTKQAQQAQAQMAQDAQMQAQQRDIALEEAAIRDEEAEMTKQQTDAELKMAQLNQKSQQPFNQASARWLEPDAMQMGQEGIMP